MFPSLKNTLDGCGATVDNGPFHYITETAFTSANSFINYYLLKSCNEKRICFIALQNTWSHYCNIGNKFGINLKSKCDDGAIKVLDGLKLLTTLLADDNIESSNNNPLSFVLDKQKHNNLENLFLYIQNIVENFRSNGNAFVIIIDSVMPLFHMGATYEEIESLVHYCNTLISSSDLFVLSSCVDKNDNAANSLSISLSHKCSVLLSIEGLSTGISKDIHGQLKIYITAKEKQKLLRHRYQFHFKIGERDVEVFAPGLASNIL